MRAFFVLAGAFVLAACHGSANEASGASVTVKLPPPRPYVPTPAFSFGSAPREQR
jgi:hypothetical protein